MIKGKGIIIMKKIFTKLSKSRKEDLAVCFIGVAMVIMAAIIH